MGQQVFGGYGYTKEYPQEQFVRDCRITMIYEGTNGIQAMDLLGRKLGMNKGKPIMDLMGEIHQTLSMAKRFERLSTLAQELEKALNKLGEVAMGIGAMAMSPKVLTAFANAYPFMEVCGDVIMGWMLMWRAAISAEKLGDEPSKVKDAAFYEGQIKTVEFFVKAILPVTFGKMKMILNGCSAAVEISDESFGGK